MPAKRKSPRRRRAVDPPHQGRAPEDLEGNPRGHRLRRGHGREAGQGARQEERRGHAPGHDALKTWSRRLGRERRKALKQVEGRLTVLQTRAKKERRALTRTADDAVRRTLAALNIPSRREVQELTRRVEELSRRIDRFRR